MKRSIVAISVVLFAGVAVAEEPEWKAMTSQERIRHANSLTNELKGSNAANDYKQLEKQGVPLSMVALSLNDQTLSSIYNNLGLEWDQLVLELDWSQDTTDAFQKYLDLNKNAIKAYKKAASRKRLYIPFNRKGSSFYEEYTSRFLLPGVRRLPMIAAASAANEQDWKTAYDWNLWQHNVVDHVMQPGFNNQYLGMRLERDACRQLLVFLHESPPSAPAQLLKKIRKNDDTRCSQELQDELDDMWAWDTISAWHEWKKDPKKFPELTAIAEMLCSQDDGILKETGLLSQNFKSVNDFKNALKKTNPARDWAIWLESGKLSNAFHSMPFPEQVKSGGEFAEKIVKLQNKVPAFALSGATSAINKNMISGRGSTKAYRAAVDTVLALLEYKKKNKTFPEKLDQLTPKVLKSLPKDPYSGKPLVYQLSDSGEEFVLYSIGPNLKDDGGTREKENPREKGDLVFWPPVNLN